MIALGFTIGALVVGLVLYLPFFLWFRFRRSKAPHAAIARELENSLRMAFVAARRLRQATVSREQLLLVLLDNPVVADVLRLCAVDIEALRAGVAAIVRDSTPAVPGTAAVVPAASPEFQRVLQRAITHVLVLGQSRGQRPDASTAFSRMPACRARPCASAPSMAGTSWSRSCRNPKAPPWRRCNVTA